MSKVNAVGALQFIAQLAMEGNMATTAIFALLKGVRDLWPKKVVDENGNTVTVPPLPDAELTAIMKAIFGTNATRNAELQAEIRAGNIPPVEG